MKIGEIWIIKYKGVEELIDLMKSNSSFYDGGKPLLYIIRNITPEDQITIENLDEELTQEELKEKKFITISRIKFLEKYLLYR